MQVSYKETCCYTHITPQYTRKSPTKQYTYVHMCMQYTCKQHAARTLLDSTYANRILSSTYMNMCACSTHTNIMPHTHNPPIYMQIAYIHSTRTYNCACKYIYKLPCCHTHHTPNSIMCCSVLQCAAVCSNVLQCAAVCCSTHTNNVAVHIQTTAVCCSTHTNNVAVHIQTTLQYTYKQLCYRTPTTHQILECVTVYCRMS